MLEEIMKAYNEINALKGKELNFAKARLERFRDNKEKEISEYLQDVYMSKEDFYDGYGVMIKKDLEQVYDEQEKKLIEEINSIQQNSVVDLKLMAEVKIETTKKLRLLKEKLLIKLKSKKSAYAESCLNLSEFKYDYDENHHALNGSDFKFLYDKNQCISNEISDIKKQISDIDLKLEEMDLTKDEIRYMMYPLTPVQQQLYDSRIKLLRLEKSNSNLELVETDNDEHLQESSAAQGNDFFANKYDFSDIVEPSRFDSTPNSYEENGDLISEAYIDLYKTVYADILSTIDDVKTVKLNPGKKNISCEERYLSVKDKEGKYNIATAIKLPEDKIPDGEFINVNDFISALDAYKKESKGRTFIVKSQNKSLKITGFGIRKLKKAIKESSALALLKEDKFSDLDIRRIFTKGFGEKKYQNIYNNDNVELNEKKEIFVSREELIIALENLFGNKKTSWLSRLKEHIIGKQNKDYDTKDDEFALLNEMIDEKVNSGFSRTK